MGRLVSQQTIANERATVGMFGAGTIEMLAREIKQDLQAIRDSIAPGESKALVSKGISFGTLSQTADGNWDVSLVERIPDASLVENGSKTAPSLIIRPFHQAGRVVSLREFSNNALIITTGSNRSTDSGGIWIRTAMDLPTR